MVDEIGKPMTLSAYSKIYRNIASNQNSDEIKRIASDSDFEKIINCICREAKTVKQISKETELTISTTYRKIKKLNENNMLILSGSINIENKREFRYQSKTNTIS